MAGLYFEEFFVGQKVTTVGRTVTEYDIATFAGLSGECNKIHADVEFGSKPPIGKSVAHGILGLSIASGLAMRTGILEGTVIVFREMTEWKFVKPIFINDTIHADLEVQETKALPRIGGGAVIIELDVKNQKEEVCQRGTWNVLVMSKPEE